MKRVAVQCFANLALTLMVAVPCFAQWQYPPTRAVDATDTYFGKTYRDPYRWLEDLQNKEVAAWFKAQAELTDSLLAKIPAKDVLTHDWTELDKLTPATYSSIAYANGRVFYKKTLGGKDNVCRLFFRQGWNGACAGLFGDVACPSQFADWIEELAVEGVTGGCGGGNYCPNNPNTRGQMAAFLVKTFGLVLYGP